MSKFKNHYNAEPAKGEVNTQPSQTVPNQALTIPEIMRRSAQGLPLTGEKVPIYHGEEDTHPDLSTMDLADREAYINEQTLQLRQLQTKITEDKEKAQKEKEARKTPKKGQEIEDAIMDEDEPSTFEEFKKREGKQQPPPTKNQKPTP